jgi:hypothetical protein
VSLEKITKRVRSTTLAPIFAWTLGIKIDWKILPSHHGFNTADLSNFFDTIAEFNSGGRVFIANYNEPRTVGISLTERF